MCDLVPFPPPTRPDSERKSVKLALGLDYWQDAMVTHNVSLPKNKQLTLSDEDINKLSGSKFSVSNGGTPTLHPGALGNEQDLRKKLLAAQASAMKRKVIEQEAKEHERKASELWESLSASPSASVTSKRKSSSVENPNQGLHALDLFLLSLKKKVEDADYIDFATMSSNRLREIKMLNITSSKSTRIAVGIIMRHCASEADITTLTDDLHQIHDGFFYHYLKIVGESQLPDPMATIMDRISWWQWMETNFKSKPAAHVKFIKSFLVDHHATPFWAPQVKLETNLVILCKHECSVSRPSPQIKMDKLKVVKQQKQKPAIKFSGQRPTPAQLAKIDEWKARFPSICLSRSVRGRPCRAEECGRKCNFAHVCAWCSAANCKAMCVHAETL